MDVVQMFADLFAKIPAHPDDLALARRLFTHENAERIVAGLVRDHLGARPSAADQAAAARRSALPRPVQSEQETRPVRPAAKAADAVRTTTRTETPVPKIRPAASDGSAPPAETHDRRKHVEEGPTVPPKVPRGRAPLKATPSEETRGGVADAARRPPAKDGGDAERPGPGATELFVNVGRKDGAKASDFYTVLLDRAGVTIDDTDYVNVRQRHTFIGIRSDLAERALGALNGATIAGREATAEPSRSRQ
jgi:hypothetical protein